MERADITQPEDDYVVFKKFPVAPSVNALYSPRRGGGLRKSDVYLAYLERVKLWTYGHGKDLEIARAITLGLGPSRFLHVERQFFLHGTSILTKKGTPKRRDTTNLVKALDDVLAKLLGCDDCWFWSDRNDKIAIAETIEEYVEVTLFIDSPTR